jgi:hypothetical protein
MANSDPPLFRHSVGWSLMSAGFALAAAFYGLGLAVANGRRLWIAIALSCAIALSLGGAAYGAFVLGRKRSGPRRGIALFASILNLATLGCAFAVAASIRW